MILTYIRRKAPLKLLTALMAVTSCQGAKEVNQRQHRGGASSDLSYDGTPRPVTADSVADVRATPNPDDEVLHTLVLEVGQTGLSLAEGAYLEWEVDMEERRDVSVEVGPKKYLRVHGTLMAEASDGISPLGCLQIELYDNVNYSIETILNISTSGIVGTQYPDLSVPLFARMNPDTEVPIHPEAINLARFSQDTVKRYNHEVCFAIDLENRPADEYGGQIIVQYLKPSIPVDDDPNYDDPPTDHELFACASDPKTLKAGQETSLAWVVPEGQGPLQIKLSGNLADLGSVENDGLDKVFYEAPDFVPTSDKVFVVATLDGYQPAFCEVVLLGEGQLGVLDDGEMEGAVGNVFVLEKGIEQLPDFSTMEPVANIVMPNIDVPTRKFKKGFPGVRDLNEWFGIRLKGKLRVPKSDTYEFQVNSDDGAILTIGGQEVVNNDGLHPPRFEEGSIVLSEGLHDFQMDYYQGPRYLIALQLFWRTDDNQPFEVIQPDFFER